MIFFQKKDVKWTFKALPPRAEKIAGLAQPTWQYADTQNPELQIFICKAPPRVPKHLETVPLRPPKRSFRDVPANTEHANILHPPSQPEVPVASRQEKDERTGRDRSRSPYKDRKAPPPAPQLIDDVSAALQRGWAERDMGGTGDCGWRSVAAALEYSKNKTDITAEQARIQGATLRAQTISHLRRKHTHEYIQFVAKDKDSAPEEPTPDLEEAWENYVETMSLPDTWIDGIALKALSTRIGVPLIIWKLKDGVWLRTTLAPQFRDYIALGKKIACL